jgi:hypothetical protein
MPFKFYIFLQQVYGKEAISRTQALMLIEQFQDKGKMFLTTKDVLTSRTGQYVGK